VNWDDVPAKREKRTKLGWVKNELSKGS